MGKSQPTSGVEFVDFDPGDAADPGVTIADAARTRGLWPVGARPGWPQYVSLLGLATAGGFAWSSAHSTVATVTVAIASANIGPNGETTAASHTNTQSTTIGADGREFVHYAGPRSLGVLDFVTNSPDFALVLMVCWFTLLLAAVASLIGQRRWQMGATGLGFVVSLMLGGAAVTMLRTTRQIARASAGLQTPTASYGSAIWTALVAAALALLAAGWTGWTTWHGHRRQGNQ